MVHRTRKRQRRGWLRAGSVGFRLRITGTRLLGLALLVWLVWRAVDRPLGARRGPESLVEGRYKLLRVVDGDTLLLANRARIRLIGVDAPESVDPSRQPEPFGREAATFVRQSTKDGQVRLRFDKERVDRYGRFLAYVYVDGVLLNEAIIANGLGTAETRFRYDESMKRRFRAAEKLAKLQRRGIWSTAHADAAHTPR